ncbi:MULTISPECIES: hypothetical protein [unclassified Streptomyces]|uniref:hypothetical protein n=1 Tax=unclassified Streptomyces TaxID=2593676 RepID=UPI0035DDB372
MRAAYEFLDGVDDQDLLRRHRSRLDGRAVGTAPDWMVEGFVGHIGVPRQLYRRAAAANAAVAKRVYA